MAGTVFWNAPERRVRAGWRILVQGGSWWVLLLVAQALLGVAARAGLLGDRTAGSPVRVLVDRLTVLVPYGLLVATVLLAARYLDRRAPADLGFHLDRRWWTDLGFGLALGTALMSLIFATEILAGWASVAGPRVTAGHGPPFWAAVLVALVAYVAVGVGEESWSRGYVLLNLAEGLRGRRVGPTAATLLAALVQGVAFALMHARTPEASTASTAVIFVLALLFATAFVLTGELAIPVGLHISWNFCQANVFGFPLNGSVFTTGTFMTTRQTGPAAWTGGGYGPEGGWLAVAAAVVGVLAVLGWLRLTGRGPHLARVRNLARPAPSPQGERVVQG